MSKNVTYLVVREDLSFHLCQLLLYWVQSLNHLLERQNSLSHYLTEMKFLSQPVHLSMASPSLPHYV